MEAGEVVWMRGLLGEVGLADGTAGNAYSFLSLYRLIGDRIFLERARAFAYRDGHKYGGERAFSLFHGLAGVACLWFDVLSPQEARFPGFEI